MPAEYWTRDSNVTITSGVSVALPVNREVHGIHFENIGVGSHARLDLNKKVLKVGKAGISANGYDFSRIDNGFLTSSLDLIDFKFVARYPPYFALKIDASIVDDEGRSVGLNLRADKRKDGGHVAMTFDGKTSNSYTGSTSLSGHVYLGLNKIGGAIAVRGDINIKDSAAVNIFSDEQISQRSRVLLSRGGTIAFWGGGAGQANIKESFRELCIESGLGVMHFNSEPTTVHGTRMFILEDLIVTAGNELLVLEWAYSRDYILVRKDSAHLQDSLGRIRFEGRLERYAGLQHYDKDYWQIIPAFPEPTTYGAILGVVALGLFACRRKNSRVSF